VPKTIQIRDVADDDYKAIARRAAEVGVTVPEWLRREIARLASRPSMSEWLERTRRKPMSNITTEEVIATMDTWRGPWPDAGR
jgi:hypothetical protein